MIDCYKKTARLWFWMPQPSGLYLAAYIYCLLFTVCDGKATSRSNQILQLWLFQGVLLRF